jgi:hypothetical protein
MIFTSPLEAHRSSVGPVYDVATWSTGKVLWMALIALPLGVAICAAAISFWSPNLLTIHAPALKGFAREIADLHRRAVWARPVGAGVAGLVGYFFVAAGVSSIVDCFRGGYHFRVGPGGFSLRIPQGIDLAKFGMVSDILELELPWDDVADWKIIQVKQLGSLSRNAGNVGANLKLRTVAGRKYNVSLDCFSQPGFIIHSRIQDALQMTPLSFGPADCEEEPVGSGA